MREKGEHMTTIRLARGVTATAHDSAVVHLPPGHHIDDHDTHIRIRKDYTLMAKLSSILDRAGIDTLGVLDAQVDVPVLTTGQRQGDVLVLPRPNKAAATTPIPRAGAMVVRAETSTRNTHSLHSWDGPVSYFDVRDPGPTGLVLGVLTVPDGATAYLVHTEEHGANAFGPGTYEIRRQREFAGEWRQVAD